MCVHVCVCVCKCMCGRVCVCEYLCVCMCVCVPAVFLEQQSVQVAEAVLLELHPYRSHPSQAHFVWPPQLSLGRAHH